MPKTVYRVCEIYRTIQGEGYWTGFPCTLVRLHGCNLHCDFCDTPQAMSFEVGSVREVKLDRLVEEVWTIAGDNDIILITGGEPTLQPLAPLVEALHKRDLGRIHLETNGTLPFVADFDWITASPKPNANTVLNGAVAFADEVKWLVQGPDDVERLQEFLHEYEYKGLVFLQPVSQDPEATRIAYEAALRHGWCLSIQVHKYIGVL